MTTVSTSDSDDKGRRYTVAGLIPADIGVDGLCVELPQVQEPETDDTAEFDTAADIRKRLYDDPVFIAAVIANMLTQQVPGFTRQGPVDHRLGDHGAGVSILAPNGGRYLITVTPE